MIIPLYILADHSSIGIDSLDIEFEAKLNFGDSTASNLKKSLLGIFKKKDYKNEVNINQILKSNDVFRKN